MGSVLHFVHAQMSTSRLCCTYYVLCCTYFVLNWHTEAEFKGTAKIHESGKPVEIEESVFYQMIVSAILEGSAIRSQ